MAYTSFRIRKDNVSSGNGGSALQRTKYAQDSSNPTGSGNSAYDSALRADNFLPVVPVEYTESAFSAEAITRSKIQLSWQLEVALATTLSGSYQPTTLVLRASNDGEPVTVNDGYAVLTVTGEDYREVFDDEYRPSAPYIAEGKWVYYSMFLLYQDNTGGAFYQRVAILSVQIPFDFGSVSSLWGHIPVYYRELDVDYTKTNEEYSYDTGPLYRFVELFGWELDKMRTTIYDTMRISDPEVIHSSAIDALGKQVGVEFNKDMLGTAKLRAILNNIGYLRRTKGTLDSVEAYISALSGCGVTTTNVNGVTTFNVHPMRANLFSDPFFDNAITTNRIGPPVWDSFTNLQDGTSTKYGWGVYYIYTSGMSAPTFSASSGTLTVTLPADSGTATVLIYSRRPFTYNNNLTYYASAESSHSFTPRFVSPATLALMEGTSPTSTVTYVDSWNNSVPVGSFPTFATSPRRVRASIPNTSSVAPTSVVPVYKFDIALNPSATTTLTFSKPLFEYRHSQGDFFSGNEPLGGFLPVVGSLGEGTYDYHWGIDGISAPHTDFSFYTLDFYRSKKVAEYIVQNYVMPVTLVRSTNYEIYWDVLE